MTVAEAINRACDEAEKFDEACRIANQQAEAVNELCTWIDELKAYRETGLTPKEIKALTSVKEKLYAAIEDIPHTCEYCAYNGVDVDVAPCADCEQMNTLLGEERWEWHGMKEG